MRFTHLAAALVAGALALPAAAARLLRRSSGVVPSPGPSAEPGGLVWPTPVMLRSSGRRRPSDR
jgi:hypothetical protein